MKNFIILKFQLEEYLIQMVNHNEITQHQFVRLMLGLDDLFIAVDEEDNGDYPIDDDAVMTQADSNPDEEN